MALDQIRAKWNEFWFAPQSPVPAGLVRILFGILFIQFAVFLAPDLHMLFGKDAMVTAECARGYAGNSRFNILDLLPNNTFTLDIIFTIYLVSAIFLTLGLFTRVSAVLVYLGLLTFDARNPYIFGAPDMVLRTVSFLLIFSHCGHALSLDRLLKVRRSKTPHNAPPEPQSPWALRLIQVYFAFVYWTAFSRKLVSQDWLDGTAVYYVAHFLEEQRFAPSIVFDNMWLCKMMSWATIGIEFALFTLIWVKEFRMPVIIIGIVFHLIMDATLVLPLFQFAMIAGLISFIEPSTLTKLSTTIKHFAKRLCANR